jgi:hypothetical protein
MRSSGAAGSIRPPNLRRPGRPLVAVSFAAVPGTTIRGTSARPTATGTPPTTGTTTTVSGWVARFSPEPARSRSRRARTKRPGPSMMRTVRSGRDRIPRRRLSWLPQGGDRRRQLTRRDLRRHPGLRAGEPLCSKFGVRCGAPWSTKQMPKLGASGEMVPGHEARDDGRVRCRGRRKNCGSPY